MPSHKNPLTTTNKPDESKRLLSLDVFRGLTVALMILVNSPGNFSPYPIISHAIWHGCTLADLVFPFFLFIVGMSLVFPLSKAKQQGIALRQVFPAIAKRSLIIFTIGLCLNAYPHHFEFAHLRILGVLQRIALCYFLGALLYYTCSRNTLLGLSILGLIAYWLVMTYLPVPNYGAGQLTPEGNFATYFDHLLLSTNHLYTPTFDPEGLFSTLPALITTVLGSVTILTLLPYRRTPFLWIIFILIGTIMASIGWIWSYWFPINKALWTSSYVLWTAGLALIVYGVCYACLETKQWRRAFFPFIILGTNAMLAYILHVFFLKTQAIILLPSSHGSTQNIRFYLTEHWFGWASKPNAALLYAVSYLLLWLGVFLLDWSRLTKRLGIFLLQNCDKRKLRCSSDDN